MFRVTRGEVRPSNGDVEVGAACRIWIPGEMRSLRPGFYCAVGEADQAEPATTPWLLRFYWHLGRRGAPAWVQALTTGLNRRRVPFRLKVVSDPRFYLRADAGVLFLEPEHYRAARPVIRRTYREVRGDLRPPVPGLSYELAPGLSVAEGPPDGESFGGHRCGLIAQALVTSGAGPGSVRERLEAVSASFRAAGVDPAHPFRAPGSQSRYRPLARSDLDAPAPVAPRRPSEGSPALGEAAEKIGDALCRSAYRQDVRCNWIGRAVAPDPGGGGFIPAIGALGANLYGGTAGVAVFLAELSALTGDPRHRQTALAALRQALGSLRSEPELSRPVAFFEGQLGVAWAGLRVATLTGSDELAEEASELLSAIAHGLPGDRREDIIEGSAGAILALLRLHEEDEGRGWLEAASKLGQELLRARGATGEAAPTAPGAPEPHPRLTGFAHGAAGLGLGLLELYAVTGNTDLREAADAHFAYEETCFDEAHRNWPDFRAIADDGSGGPARPPGFMTAWCHGAAGIALSRLRAMQVDPERAQTYEPIARAGLATTLERIESLLADSGSDESLCHGISGLADVTFIGGQVLGEEDLTRSARRAMEELVSRRSNEGPVAASDPSLFLGDAGVGFAMLRLEDSERVATVLLPGARF